MKLIVEGWRHLSHSYAVLNQWHLLELAKRPDIDLRIAEPPFFNPNWRKQTGLFPLKGERVLRELRPSTPDFRPDASWRVSFPLDLTPPAAGVALVYGTAEGRVVPPSFLKPTVRLAETLARPSVMITTPSRWSAEGFKRLGFPETRIVVIPHGIDPKMFRPRPELRKQVRKRLGLSGFVFMSVGAMSENKGMDVLLRAFATIAERRKDVRLLLKGSDSIYTSQQWIAQNLKSLPRVQANLVTQRMLYRGDAFSMEQMASLYQAADAYVSPYRAEGFNIPVLEAAACGVPVICTRGGSTDDFVDDSFAWRIDSRLRSVVIDGAAGEALEPDVDHLVALMERLVEAHDFRQAAARLGPAHAAGRFSWESAVDQTLRWLATRGGA